MMPPNSDPSFLSFLPILITCTFTGVISWYLSNDKGRNAVGWTIFGCMPLIGSATKSLEDRLEIKSKTDFTLNVGQTYYNPEEDWAYAVVES